ncbi:ParA family protein [Polyangium sp. 15x6]|uniref:ParA family protein n=1 Tax=Polyangium sp. 15x6 TaxID=3042687 RepID=UPI00249A091A|nr:ParA family protein [Polyangium sp. 15x6]MDI3286360.1 ParA family protein [Polyangium sp. 15x6]
MKTIAFFNNKGGVGKTSLVYHLAWMFRLLGRSVVAVDLDPQSNLTTAFLPQVRLEQLWGNGQSGLTVLAAVQPLMERLGDLRSPHVEEIAADMFSSLSLVPGDLGLSMFEDRLAAAWKDCMDDNPAEAGDAFRVMSSFHRIMERATSSSAAEVVLIDVGPNLGALNRAALVAADYVVVPLGADVFSLQGLRNLGPTLSRWRSGWRNRLANEARPPNISLPKGEMWPIGYVIMQHSAREERPVQAYQRWIDRIPDLYHELLLGEAPPAPSPDEHMLATIRHYRSLMPLAQEARKPMFLLRPADGAIGSHAAAVQRCYRDFEQLARRIAQRAGIDAS